MNTLNKPGNSGWTNEGVIMAIDESLVQTINGKKYISTSLLEQLLNDRDYSIRRIKHATEMRNKQRLAQYGEKIAYPDEFQKYGELADVFMEPYVSGFTLDLYGSMRCQYGAIGSPVSLLSPLLYRGEIKDYGNSSGYSSLGRKIAFGDGKHVESKCIHFFKEQVRKIMFMGFLTHFRQFHEFPFGEPLDGVLAQHYGLDTQFIDLTDDLKVALFFACCKHMGNNKYRPITQDDITQIGTDGVIICGSNKLARVIGYQPFCRCHRQRGYYIDSSSIYPCWDYCLSENNGFVKYYFKRTPELSQRIFAEFDGGRYLFLEDDLFPFLDIVDRIKKANEIPVGAFDCAYTICKLYFGEYKKKNVIQDDLYTFLLDRNALMEKLQNDGLKFCEQLSVAGIKPLIESVNEKWNPEEFAKAEGIEFSPFYVLTEHPSENMW